MFSDAFCGFLEVFDVLFREAAVTLLCWFADLILLLVSCFRFAEVSAVVLLITVGLLDCLVLFDLVLGF